MQEALFYVMLVVVGVSVVVAVVALVGSGKVWEQVGRGAMSLNDGADRRAGEAPAQSGGGGSQAERDDEVRQMLEARNARRIARGQDPLDIEAELRRLTAPAIDEGLRSEVRALVEARNARRARQGRPPLDVESEVDRQLRALQDL